MSYVLFFVSLILLYTCIRFHGDKLGLKTALAESRNLVAALNLEISRKTAALDNNLKQTEKTIKKLEEANEKLEGTESELVFYKDGVENSLTYDEIKSKITQAKLVSDFEKNVRVSIAIANLEEEVSIGLERQKRRATKGLGHIDREYNRKSSTPKIQDSQIFYSELGHRNTASAVSEPSSLGIRDSEKCNSYHSSYDSGSSSSSDSSSSCSSSNSNSGGD